MPGGFPHHQLGRDDDREPDPKPRPYKITILLDEVSETEAVEIAHELADVLAARGIAILEADDTVRSAIGVEPGVWPESLGLALEGDLAGALHIVVPKAVPQAPDLGLGYSPN